MLSIFVDCKVRPQISFVPLIDESFLCLTELVWLPVY